MLSFLWKGIFLWLNVSSQVIEITLCTLKRTLDSSVQTRLVRQLSMVYCKQLQYTCAASFEVLVNVLEWFSQLSFTLEFDLEAELRSHIVVSGIRQSLSCYLYACGWLLIYWGWLFHIGYKGLHVHTRRSNFQELWVYMCIYGCLLFSSLNLWDIGFRILMWLMGIQSALKQQKSLYL